MTRLLHSSKFWTMVFDVAVSLATLLLTHYLAPESADFALKIIASVQPVILAVIVGIFVEDAAAKRAGNDPNPGRN